MSKKLSIAMFIDACGWEIVAPRPWFMRQLSHRQSVESLFGYSSACVPAILTGRRPNENDHWSSFFYAPKTSPFKTLRPLRHLPASIIDRGRVRGWVSKGLARAFGFTGYFQIYSMPFKILPLFDYAEKKDIFRPGGINKGPSIFDYLADEGVTHHVSNWRLSETKNLVSLEQAVSEGEISFAFLYTAGLDGLMHDVTKESPQVDDKLKWYERRIAQIMAQADERYDEVRFAVFSDHGMATVKKVVSLMPQVEATGLVYGHDFAAVYDSTMMRFWFLRKESEAIIRAALPDGKDGRWVTEEEHVNYGTKWDDSRFGDAVYALEPGVLLNPSHMGNVALKGMHGYRPDHEDSFSSLLSSFEPETRVENITDLHTLMVEMADWSVS